MKRSWNKYINKNKYSECQLITALNAYYYLTGKQYCKQDSKEYENLVDLGVMVLGVQVVQPTTVHLPPQVLLRNTVLLVAQVLRIITVLLLVNFNLRRTANV